MQFCRQTALCANLQILAALFLGVGQILAALFLGVGCKGHLSGSAEKRTSYMMLAGEIHTHGKFGTHFQASFNLDAFPAA